MKKERDEGREAERENATVDRDGVILIATTLLHNMPSATARSSVTVFYLQSCPLNGGSTHFHRSASGHPLYSVDTLIIERKNRYVLLFSPDAPGLGHDDSTTVPKRLGRPMVSTGN